MLQKLGQRWEQYRPSKTATFWTSALSVIVVLVLGFGWGGWVTGGTASKMVQEATEKGRLEVASAICVDRFANATDARLRLGELKEITSAFRRTEFVERGGWATLPSAERPERPIARLCAEQLANLELPPVEQATEASAEQAPTTAIQ